MVCSPIPCGLLKGYRRGLHPSLWGVVVVEDTIMEWVIEQRRGNDHGGDRYLRKSKAGNLVWGDLHDARVFNYASKAQKFLHKSGEDGLVVELNRSSPEDSFWLIMRPDGSHNG